MNELNRTVVFAVIAVVLSAITYFTMPSVERVSPADRVGQHLFPEFEDPLEATSLEVVKYDEDTGSANTFRVAKIDHSWVIPSHENYPADAENQLADVAAEWIDLEVLGVATDPEEAGVASDDIRGLHKLYGVVDPLEGDTAGGEGIGTRVVMRDPTDEPLVRLVIGKEVEEQPSLHYVRVVGQDPVYTVEVDTSKLSTRFEDWIEDDLLKLSGWDIRKVDIDDYSVDVLQGYITPRGQISLEHNDTGDPRWNLLVDRVYTEDGWEERGLGEDEELDTDTLNDLKNSLDDLKIVDVRRKPEGLSETLRSSGSINLDPEAERSLSKAGFHVVPVSDPANPGQQRYELRSNEGEISATMKDGVKYVLRFGQIAGMGSDEEKEQKDAGADETDEAGEEAESGVNRYLFVMAQMDRSMIEEPDYEELPELPSDDAEAQGDQDEAAEKKAEKAEPANEKPKEKEEPENEAAGEAKAKAEKKEKPEGGDDSEQKPEKPAPADAKPEKEEGEKPESKAEKPEEGNGNGEAEEKPEPASKPEEKKADGAKPEAEKPEEPAGDDAPAEKAEKAEKEEPKLTPEEIEKKREEIEKENARKKEEYEQKIKEAEEEVNELNARFSDWYYIIDNEEYQKIHLNRDKIVKEKEEEEEDGEGDSAADSPASPAGPPNSIGNFEDLKLNPPAEKP